MLARMEEKLQPMEAQQQARQQEAETFQNWLVSVMVSVLLPLGQNFQYFYESFVPVLMAKVNPYYPDGPPVPEPTRQCSVMAGV